MKKKLILLVLLFSFFSQTGFSVEKEKFANEIIPKNEYLSACKTAQDDDSQYKKSILNELNSESGKKNSRFIKNTHNYILLPISGSLLFVDNIDNILDVIMMIFYIFYIFYYIFVIFVKIVEVITFIAGL